MSGKHKTKAQMVQELALMISDRMDKKRPAQFTPEDPEYVILDDLLNEEQLELLLAFKKLRVSRTPRDMAKRLHWTIDRAERVMKECAVIGMLETDRENAVKELQYDIPINVPGSAEFMIMNPESFTEAHPYAAEFFDYASFKPFGKMMPLLPPGGAGAGMHVIPVEKAIDARSESADVEHLSHWLKKYDKYSLGVCSCRKMHRMLGNGSGDIEGNCCIGVGDMAEYQVETGKGRYATYEEVVEVLERAERNGFVHQITNIDGKDKIIGICNCSPVDCNALRISQYYNTPNANRSAYRAHVDKEKCVACGKCVEVCPMGAAKLGQKLCTKAGEIRYPKHDLPDDLEWGPDRWDEDYREKVKINCYDTGTAPCKTACPAHLAVQGYIKMAREGRYLDALKLIKQDNPFPAVCGAVCNRRCEDACTRGTIDEPIAIDEVKKFIAAKELNAETRYVPRCETPFGDTWGDDYKIAVIGAGPAGMSAAYFLRERGYEVTVFEKEARAGGMLLSGIPSFRLEKDVIQAEIDVLVEMGIQFQFGVDVGKDVTLNDLRDQGYKAFYVAIGCQGGRKAGVPGEDGAGVESGIAFLRAVNQDHTVRLDGDTVVIGGGNVAVDVARSAVRAGDGAVSMYCLESAEEMPAAQDEIDEAREEGIGVHNGWGPKAILRDEAGHVKSVVFKRCTQVFDDNHRFAPQYDEEDTVEVACANVLLAIGQTIEWGDLLKDEKVQLRGNGGALADPVTLQTDQPDIFVGGDVFTGPKFAIDAIAAGKAAAESIHRYVHPGQLMKQGRDLRQFIELDKDDIVVDSYDRTPRQWPGRKAGDPKQTFADLRKPFTEAQLKKETARCLGCGTTEVDENKCIGCGLCTTRCEFDAIHLTRDLPEASRMVAHEDRMKVVLPYMIKRKHAIRKRKRLEKKQ
jgi:NADPH-dependent glutamate synthase beta subunit-like oxidoreductase